MSRLRGAPVWIAAAFYHHRLLLLLVAASATSRTSFGLPSFELLLLTARGSSSPPLSRVSFRVDSLEAADCRAPPRRLSSTPTFTIAITPEQSHHHHRHLHARPQQHLSRARLLTPRLANPRHPTTPLSLLSATPSIGPLVALALARAPRPPLSLVFFCLLLASTA